MNKRLFPIRFKYLFLASITLSLILIASCSSIYSGKADIGESPSYVTGIPNFTLQAKSFISEDNEPGINIYLALQEGSLIYKSQLDTLLSRVQIDVDIKSKDGERLVSKSYQQLIGKNSETRYYEQDTIYRRISYMIPNGNYVVSINILDLHSGKSNSVTQELTVPDPYAEDTFLNQISLFRLSADNEIYEPVNGYNINTGFDTLKADFQIRIGQNEEPVEVTLKLLKFAADHEPARPLSGREHRNYSLEKKGLDYAKTETIHSTKRTLNSSGNVTIENSYVDLPIGNYRLEVTVRNDSKVLFEVRDFGIRSENYPQVKNARELAAPLYYLMDKNEYEEMMSISAQDSIKKVVDSFWLNNIQNASKAKEIIKMYYDRVESANQRFGNFKEGWKTDPGMIFILFGSPLYYDSGFGEMTWYYEFDTSIDKRGFYFKDTRFGNNKFPFQNYHLERTKDYFGLEFKQIQSWKDGSILYLSQR